MTTLQGLLHDVTVSSIHKNTGRGLGEKWSS